MNKRIISIVSQVKSREKEKNKMNNMTNNMKRIIALVLACCMTFGSIANAAGAEIMKEGKGEK